MLVLQFLIDVESSIYLLKCELNHINISNLEVKSRQFLIFMYYNNKRVGTYNFF